MYDKWLFALKNLTRLLDRPKAFQERIFRRLFEQAEIARYTLEERHEYEESVKEYRDYINTVDTAHEKGWNEGREVGRAEGREEGIEENKRNTARSMKEDGLPLGVIAKYT
jgi:predicted transposase/invertase (TIGR01784 family)